MSLMQGVRMSQLSKCDSCECQNAVSFDERTEADSIKST